VTCLIGFIINMTAYYPGGAFTSLTTINAMIRAVIYLILELLHACSRILERYYIVSDCPLLLIFKKNLSIGYNCNATAIRQPRDFQESNSRAKVAWRSNRSPLAVVTSLILVCRGHSNKLDKYTNYVAYKHKFIRSKKWFIIMPPSLGRGIKQ